MSYAEELLTNTGRLRLKRCAVWMGALLIPLAAPAIQNLHAQQLGGINGTVTDTTGAVIPGARVTALNASSGFTYNSVTGPAGTFLLINVIPGSYTVMVEAPGFDKFVQNDFRVDIGATAAVMATLKPGSTAASVEVNGGAIPLLTEQPDIGTTIEPQIWNDMPAEVNGGPRDPRTVALSNIPGVEFYAYGYGKIAGAQYGAEFNYFNGLPQNSNATMTPPYDFINETHVDTTSIDANYGWGVGAVQFETKFGTNQLHGSAFEINRNSFFDSRGPFDPAPNPVPVNHQNDYGFSVGGPVWLPKVYNGHNKTFFYFSWEKFQQNNQSTGSAITGYATVPTDAMKTGDFSGLMTTNQSGQVVQAPIYNTIPALGGSPTNPPQFSCNGVANVICPGMLSATALSLVKYIPSPNTTGTGPGNLENNYYYNISVPDEYHRWAFSIDEHFNANQSVNVAVTQSPTPQIAAYNGPAIFGGIGSPNPLSDLIRQVWPSGFVYGNYVWSIHPNLLFTAGVSVPFDYSFTRTGLESTLTIPAQNLAGAPVKGFPTITFNGIDAPQNFGKGSGMAAVDTKTPYYSAYSNINWTAGRHTLNFGWQGMYYMNYGWSCESCVGQFNFLGSTTDNYNGSTLNPYAGSPFASFMLGEADSASLSYSPEVNLKYATYGLYVQDAMKVNPKLTVNAGLRWDIQVPQWTNNGEQDFVTPQSLQIANTAAGGQLGTLTRYGTCSTNCAGFNRASIHWGELGPRFGFSYAVDHETVLSGGFSTLWQQANSPNNSSGWNNDGNAFGVSNTINGTGTNMPGFGDWDTNTLNFPPPATFSNAALVGQGVGYFDPAVSGRDPYYFLWNVGVQRTLPHYWFIRSSYVGQRGIHLVLNPQNINLYAENVPAEYGQLLAQPITSQAALNAGIQPPFANFAQVLGSSATVGQALKPYPQYTGIKNNFNSTGFASYNAWQTEIDKRYSGGLALLSGFTLQRTITNASGVLGWAGGMSTLAVNPYNPSTAIAPSGPDWMTNVAGTYDLPVGPGKMWFNNNHLTGEFIGGWKLAWGLYYGSGSPHSVGADGSPFGYGNLADRVQTAGIIKAGGSYSHSIKRWIEAGAPAGNAAPAIVQNNGAFVDPAVAEGYQPGSQQFEWIAGNAQAGYDQFRDPPYANEQVGMMKEFAMTERAKGILRVDYFNPLNRWYTPWCVDTNIDDGINISGDGSLNPGGNFGRVNNAKCGDGAQRQGQMTFRIEF
jgi:hypothetical protein